MTRVTQTGLQYYLCGDLSVFGGVVYVYLLSPSNSKVCIPLAYIFACW